MLKVPMLIIFCSLIVSAKFAGTNILSLKSNKATAMKGLLLFMRISINNSNLRIKLYVKCQLSKT
jgi:hypothetical protein